MADRYWVGGTGNINDTSKWSTTSGGAGGASVPTSADNAYFDGASDTGAAFTVTVNVAFDCNDLIIGDGVTVTALDQTLTFAGGFNNFNIHGSLYFPATNFSFTSYNVTFLATTTGKTITTNGSSFINSNISWNGIGGGWTLGGAVTTGGNLTITNGSLDTGNYNVTCFSILSTNSNVRSISLGSSTISCFGLANFTISTNLTFNAGTSKFVMSNTNPTIGGGGQTFYDVETTTTILGTISISGVNTFNNITTTSRLTAGLGFLSFSNNQTINGTLSLQSANTNPGTRLLISGNVTLTCAAITIGDGVDFRDITIAGAAVPFDASAKSTGDLGGNSGITFPAPKTVYWNLAGSQKWYSVGWATTPTGTPAAANFPLGQDTAVITESGAAGTIEPDTANGTEYRIGTLTFDDGVSPRTSGVTLNFVRGLAVLKDLKLSSGVIISGTSAVIFGGRTTQNITSAGKTFTNGITLDSPGGTLVLDGNLTLATNQTFTLTRGTLNLNGAVLSTGLFGSSNSNTRSIAFGTSRIEISGNNAVVFGMETATNFSYTGTPNFNLIYSGSSGSRGIRVITGVNSSNAVNINVTSGTDAITSSNGNQSVKNLNFTGFSGTYTGGTQFFFFGNLIISSTMTVSNPNDHIFLSPSEIQTITTNGRTLDFGIIKQDAGTLRLEDNLTMGSTRTFLHTQGTVNLNGKVLTCQNWSSTNSNIRALIFGAGQLILSGSGTVWTSSIPTNYTITPGNGKIVLSNNTNTARTFAGGGITTYPELEIGGDTGTATTTLTGANGFTKLTNTKTVAYTIVFPNAETRVANWNLNGSEGNLITLERTGGSGTFTVRYTGNQYALGRYLSISNSTAQPLNRMYAIYSTNGGGNTNWIFDAPKFSQFINFFDIA